MPWTTVLKGCLQIRKTCGEQKYTHPVVHPCVCTLDIRTSLDGLGPLPSGVKNDSHTRVEDPNFWDPSLMGQWVRMSVITWLWSVEGSRNFLGGLIVVYLMDLLFFSLSYFSCHYVISLSTIPVVVSVNLWLRGSLGIIISGPLAHAFAGCKVWSALQFSQYW